MFKQVRKSIKQIQFLDDRAVLQIKWGGRALFWLLIILGGIAVPGGIILGIGAEDISFFLIFCGLGLACLIFAFFSPIYEWFEFDQADKSFKYFSGTARTKDDPARAKVKSFALNTLIIDWNSARYLGSVTVMIQPQDSSSFFLSIPKNAHEELLKWLEGEPDKSHTAIPAEEGGIETGEIIETPPPAKTNLIAPEEAMGHATMLQEINSWGRSSIVFGIIHLVASGFLSPSWGITLLAVGGLSFLVQEASMFILYAVALVWVGVSNMLSLDIGLWTLFGLYQIYLGIRLFGKFKRYREYEQQHLASFEEIPSHIKTGRAARYFPWVGSGLGLLGLFVYGGTWVYLIVSIVLNYADNQSVQMSDAFLNTLELVAGVALGFGMVGFALSLASVVSKYKPRWLAWVGVVMGAILVLIEILLNIWVIFGG